MSPELIDTLWVLTAGALVFFMQAGFAFLESGLTRSKNSINVAIKNLTDLGVSLVCFWLFGFALMFGRSISGLFGATEFALSSEGDLWVAAFFFFQAMFCSTSATIVSGAVAERMRYSSYIVATILLSAVIYPVFGHWAWGGFLTGEVNGWLGQIGFIDFAGSTVVHSIGGWMSLAALIVIGPRAGVFSESGPSRRVPGSSIPMAVVGVIILWFGWFGFNGGSTLALNATVPQIITNTALAAAAGMIASLAIGWPYYKKPDVSLVLNGSLAGLVAITAPCAYVTEFESILIGGIGGLVMFIGVLALEKLRIDDAVGAIPVHLAAGIWGTLSVALFGEPELLGTGLSMIEQLGVQALGVTAAGVWAFGIAILFLSGFNRFSRLRVTEDEEQSGLNVAEHGASTEIFDLYRTLDQQARTGDTSLRVAVEPFTEVGQIAARYNDVMDSLEENLVAKSEYLSILDNVSDALFLIDSELRIGPFYSVASEQILGNSQLANAYLPALIGERIPEGMRESVVDFLHLLFDRKIDLRTLSRLNPLKEQEFYFDDNEGGFETRHLRVSFVRISPRAGVDRVMVIAHDATSEVELNRAVESARRESQSEMELFYRMIHIHPDLLKEFISAADERLRRVNRLLGSAESDLPSILEAIARNIHAIKGDAQLFELDYIADRAEAFEWRIEQLRQLPQLRTEDFVPLAVGLTELRKQIDVTRDLVDRLVSFQTSFAAQNATGRDIVRTNLESLVKRLARELGKRVVLDTDGFAIDHVPSPARRKVRDMLVQLARNAVFHGIESPEERISRGKLEMGILKVASHVNNGNVVISVRDDGTGVNARLLRDRAIERGILTTQTARDLKSKDLIQLMFLPGMSTAPEPTDETAARAAEEEGVVATAAGRGVGMPLVRQLLRELGGQLHISTKTGEFMEFRLSIPANA